MVNFNFPAMSLKSSHVRFESGLCMSCPIIVQTFFNTNFTIALNIVDSTSPNRTENEKDFLFYKFELGKGGSYVAAPTVTTIYRAADFISDEIRLIKTLSPKHSRLLLDSMPDHRWSPDKDALLMSFAGIDPGTSTLYYVVCRVDGGFECEKLRTTENSLMKLDAQFDKIKANSTHVVVSFKSHALSFSIKDPLTVQHLIFSHSISKVVFYEGRWYGVCNNKDMCVLVENGEMLEVSYYLWRNKQDLQYTELITTTSYLVAKYEAGEGQAGFHIIAKEDRIFESENRSSNSNITKSPDLIMFPHDLNVTEMPKRYYEFYGRFMFVNETDLTMFVVPPTLSSPPGKNVAMQRISQLNRTNSIAGDRILISLPLHEGQNSFALITEDTRAENLTENTKSLLINEAGLSNGYLDFNDLSDQELMETPRFEFEAYYLHHPNFKKVKYSIEFIESKKKPKMSLVWILGGVFSLFFVLFVIFCLSFNKAIKASKQDSLKPEDCSLMEPIIPTSTPVDNKAVS